MTSTKALSPSTQPHSTSDNTYDAIVIGSGIGGLTAAGLLTKVANKRVLVLEKHSEPGGYTHVFRRDGAEWDTGVHYVGMVDKGSPMRAYFDYLSGGDLDWHPLPSGYDRIILPNIDTTFPSGATALEAHLMSLFPEESRGIRAYFKDIRRASRWATLHFMQTMVPKIALPFIRMAKMPLHSLAISPTEEVVNRHIHSPELRAILCAQWGDYGLPPARSAFAMHAVVASHYFDGAGYPEGGSSRIARTIERTIEEGGGAVRIAQDVREIVTNNGRAIGVRVRDLRNSGASERIYYAPIIISSIGAKETYNQLLPTTGRIGAVTASERQKLAHLEESTSGISVHLRLNRDPRDFGLRGENLWIYRSTDHNAIANGAQDLLDGHCQGLFASFSSLKSGSRHHTVELLTFINDSAFEKWKSEERGQRGADYSALKERAGQGIVNLFNEAVPGIADAIEFMDIASPLTYEHYTGHEGGGFYGLAATPQRLKGGHFGPTTPIEGLYFAGQDVLSPGIAGAMMGGVAAAVGVLGPSGFPQIQAAIKKAAKDGWQTNERKDNAPLPEGKFRATLISKRLLTGSIWEVDLQIDGDMPAWLPGQYARIEVAPYVWRDYSIAGVNGRNLRFLISTRTGGLGSQCVESAKPGHRLQIEFPLGTFGATTPADRRRIFIATGTGLAPFLPIFATDTRDSDLLFFGAKTQKEDLTQLVDSPYPRTIHCISREEVSGAEHYSGRVTGAIAQAAIDWANSEAYICGSGAMVADTVATLERLGAAHIHTEPY